MTCRLGCMVVGVVLAGYAGGTTTQPIDTLQRIRDTGAMAIGVREAAFPFSFIDEGRSPQGYSIDLWLKLADAIKNELGLPRLEVRYIPVSPANQIAALQDGKIDLECGSTSNTRARQKEVAFAYTTFIAGIKLLVRKSSQITGIDDLRGKTIVVAGSTTGEKLMHDINAARLMKMNIVVAADHELSFKAIDEGSAIAFPIDDVMLYGLIAKARRPTISPSSARICRSRGTRSCCARASRGSRRSSTGRCPKSSPAARSGTSTQNGSPPAR